MNRNRLGLTFYEIVAILAAYWSTWLDNDTLKVTPLTDILCSDVEEAIEYEMIDIQSGIDKEVLISKLRQLSEEESKEIFLGVMAAKRMLHENHEMSERRPDQNDR